MVTAAVGREEDFPMSRKMCRLLTVVALLVLTATAAAQAAGHSVPRTQTRAVTAAWERIAGWFRSLPGLSVTGSGAGLDLKTATPPNAGDPPPTNGATSDEGSSMDPNGR